MKSGKTNAKLKLNGFNSFLIVSTTICLAFNGCDSFLIFTPSTSQSMSPLYSYPTPLHRIGIGEDHDCLKRLMTYQFPSLCVKHQCFRYPKSWLGCFSFRYKSWLLSKDHDASLSFFPPSSSVCFVLILFNFLSLALTIVLKEYCVKSPVRVNYLI
jgi:hypothetical protein